MARNCIGVDLAKDFLEVCDPVRGRSRVANRPKAVAHWVAGLGETDFVVYEATSGCDRPLRVALAEAGRPGARVNPLHAWHYARSRNRAKTDRLDAALLADYGRERQPAPDPALDPAREALRALVGRRDQLRPTRRSWKCRRRTGFPAASPKGRRRWWCATCARGSPGSRARSPGSRRRSATRSRATRRSPATRGCCARSPTSGR